MPKKSILSTLSRHIATERSFILQLLCAFGMGGLAVLAFAPWRWFWLVFLLWGGLYLLLCQAASLKRAVCLGFSFGLGLFLCGVSWVYVSMANVGGLPPLFAALLTLVFCTLLAGYYALAVSGFYFCRQYRFGASEKQFVAILTRWRFLAKANQYHSLLMPLNFATFMCLGELLRGYLFSGFPWLNLGYSQLLPSPLAGYAPLLGVYGVSWISALLAAFLVEILCFAQFKLAVIPLLIAIVGGGATQISWTDPNGRSLHVALIQGNIPQMIKWDPDYFADTLRAYTGMIEAYPAQLTVLPETALPVFIEQLPSEYLNYVRQLAERRQGDIVLGLPYGDNQRYWNALFTIGHSPSQVYTKNHLVPFGEIVPWGFNWFARMTNIPFSYFTAGPSPQALLLQNQALGFNICYEDAFGEEIRRMLPQASILVNASNTAWFGDSLAPDQHSQIAQMRSLEMGRPSLRATNTGLTAIIDARGQIVDALPKFQAGVLSATVSGYQGLTPYIRYGNWPIIILSMLIVAMMLFRQKKFNSGNQKA